MARDWIDQYNRDTLTPGRVAVLIIALLLFGVAAFAYFTRATETEAPRAAATAPGPVPAFASTSEPPAAAAPLVLATRPGATRPAETSSAPASLPAARVAWPNSNAWLHFSSGSTPQPLKWSSPRTDPILAPPVIWAAQATREEGGQVGQERLVRFIRQHRAGAMIGRYFSCCTIRPQPQLFPAESVPAEAMQQLLLPASWSPQEPTRRYIDVRRPEARQLLARLLVGAARNHDFLALDNFTFDFGGNPDGTTREEWTAANYALLSEIYAEARRNALPVMINASTRPEETWARVTQICDGILFEMPFHSSNRKAPAEMQRELAAYRAALDAGKFVGLIPLAPPNRTVLQRSEEDRLVAAGAMLIREAGDALFVSQTSYQPTPADWMEWPARFGKALGKYRQTGTTCVREFEQVTLTIEWISGCVDVSPRAAPLPAGK